MSESERRLRMGGTPPSLQKQKSWSSPDSLRDEKWKKRCLNQMKLRRGRSSVTEDDLEELRGCFELGLSLDSPDLDPNLLSTFPALEIFQPVNRRQRGFSRSSSSATTSSDTSSSVGSPRCIVDPGEDPEMVKAKLKQWAKVVACSVRPDPKMA